MKCNHSSFKNIKSSFSKEYFTEILEYEIDKRIHYFGPYFKTPWKPQLSLREWLILSATNVYKLVKVRKPKQGQFEIFSSAPFNFNHYAKSHNLNIIIPNWVLKKGGTYIGGIKFQRKFNRLYQIISKAELGELLSESTFHSITDVIEDVKKEIGKRNIIAGFFQADLGFFERLFIDIFKQLKIPTFIFLHGLPGRYNAIDDNRADYLLVWGEKIKENYVNAGVKKDKIFVTGHPDYIVSKIEKNLKFSTSNILIISKSINGAPSDSMTKLDDNRDVIFTYLLKVQKSLTAIGVTSVRLRLHPSENKDWYRKTFDMEFFKIDKESLTKSLSSSTLVIGPTSTVFLDSIIAGVNYLVFEPNSYTQKVDPFDGSNSAVPVARCVDGLSRMLVNKTSVNPLILREYINHDFNLSTVWSAIKLPK